MLQAIQDEVIKRALDFFGLRGPITHDYESTVIPTVHIGDLGQRTLSFQSGTDVSAPFPVVPPGKVWRPIAFSGRITQAGGAVAIVLSWTVGGLGNVGFLVPFYFSPSGSAGTGGEQLRHAFALNTVNDVTVIFPENLLIPAGSSFQGLLVAGNGTITLSSGSILLVHELGEGLVSLQ